MYLVSCFFRHTDKFESMENAGVQPEYIFKDDIYIEKKASKV